MEVCLVKFTALASGWGQAHRCHFGVPALELWDGERAGGHEGWDAQRRRCRRPQASMQAAPVHLVCCVSDLDPLWLASSYHRLRCWIDAAQPGLQPTQPRAGLWRSTCADRMLLAAALQHQPSSTDHINACACPTDPISLAFPLGVAPPPLGDLLAPLAMLPLCFVCPPPPPPPPFIHDQPPLHNKLCHFHLHALHAPLSARL